MGKFNGRNAFHSDGEPPAPGAQGRSASALQLVDSQTSRCAEVRTLDGGDPAGAATGSFLTRRLGLIVGSCMGCVVFLILIAVLSYTKIRQVNAYFENV